MHKRSRWPASPFAHPRYVRTEWIARRESEQKTLTDLVSDPTKNIVILNGPRGMGKSTFAMSITEDSRFSVLDLIDLSELDFREGATAKAAEIHIAKCIQYQDFIDSNVACANLSIHDIAAQLEVGADSKRPVIVVDEVDALPSVEQERLYQTVCRSGSSTGKLTPFWIFICGEPIVRVATPTTGLPVIRLSRLSESEVQKALDQFPANRLYGFSAEAAKYIWEMTGGYPLALQAICSELFEKRWSRDDPQTTVEKDEIESIVVQKLIPKGTPRIHHAVEQAGPGAYRFCKTLASLQPNHRTTERLRSAYAEQWPDSLDHFDPAFTGLQATGILWKEHDFWRCSPLLLLYITNLTHPIEIVPTNSEANRYYWKGFDQYMAGRFPEALAHFRASFQSDQNYCEAGIKICESLLRQSPADALDQESSKEFQQCIDTMRKSDAALFSKSLQRRISALEDKIKARS